MENPEQWEKFKKDVKAQIKEVEKEVKESEEWGPEAATISAVTVPFFQYRPSIEV